MKKIGRIIAGMSAAAIALSALSLTVSAEEFDFAAFQESGEAVSETLFPDSDVLFEDVNFDIDDSNEVLGAEAENGSESSGEQTTGTTKQTFKAVIEDAEIDEKDIEGEEGWSEYTVPYSYVSDFPKGEAVKVTIDYTKRRSYISSQEQVVSTGHDVTKANVAFVIDRTGSMYDEIQSVKDNLTLVVNTLKDRNIDVKFAIIDYNDEEITFHDINGSKWSNDYNAVIEVLDSLRDDGWEELPFSAYEKLFTETPDWYTTSDANFVFLLTDEDSDDYNSDGSIDSNSDSTTTRTMAEWVTYLDDLGIYNTVVTTQSLYDYYKTLYEGTGGEVLDITSSDYGTLMADFASHVEDRVTHTVIYQNYETTIVGGDGKIIVKGLKNGETSYDVTGDETGTIEMTVSAANASQYFSEDPNNPGFTSFKIKDFGLDITKITLESTTDVPDPEPQSDPEPQTDPQPNPVDIDNNHYYVPIPVENYPVYVPSRTPAPVAAPAPVEETKTTSAPVAVVQEQPADNIIKKTGGEIELSSEAVPYAAAGIAGLFAAVGLTALAVVNKKKRSRR